MGNRWRKAKQILALHTCASVRKDELPMQDFLAQRSSQTETSISDSNYVLPVTKGTSRSSSPLQPIRTSIPLFRSTCAICLEAMKPGSGHAIFTAECSHTFHFFCIACNVKHGNLVCPVCRAKWKEVPWEAPVGVSEGKLGGNRTRRSLSIGAHQSVQRESPPNVIVEVEEEMRRLNPVLRISDESVSDVRALRRISHPLEHTIYDDDEPLNVVDRTSQGMRYNQELSPLENQEIPSSEIEDRELVVDNRGKDQSGIDFGTDRRELDSLKLEAFVTDSDTSEGSCIHSFNLSSKLADGEKLVEAESSSQQPSTSNKVELRGHAETKSIGHSKPCKGFIVLVHLKAAAINKKQSFLLNKMIEPDDMRSGENNRNVIRSQNTLYIDQGRNHARDNEAGGQSPAFKLSSRAPLDLVTVVDVSGSMAGTKLLLLKRALFFVIQNLGPADRLSVVTFSSSAKRLFPLRLMSPEGRQGARQAVDALVSTGGTNISEGLRKAAKVLKERRNINPVATIMLLSDGQDTCSNGAPARCPGARYRYFSPGSLTCLKHGCTPIPVHTFGFGADHDATTMHSISEASGGTFSFIQAEGSVQDAFARCIGGLLSVVVQEVEVAVSIPSLQHIEINNIEAGSYKSCITDHGRNGHVELGHLYAEEERDILFELKIPPLESPLTPEESKLKFLKVNCTYKDPVSQEIFQTMPVILSLSCPDPVGLGEGRVNLDVDRQRNRLFVARTISEVKSLADATNIDGAQRVLQNAKAALQKSEAFRCGDELSKSLETELNEIQERMANRHIYERLGRAYILSAESSHFQQRATTRGESVDGHSSDYQTPSMMDMVLQSQTISLPTSRSRSTISTEVCLNKPSYPTKLWMRRQSNRAL